MIKSGGYYDLTLAKFKDVNIKNRPLLIGLGYSMQEVESLPIDPWDICLDMVVTEKDINH